MRMVSERLIFGFVPGFVPGLVPSLPSLRFEAGKREALQIGRLPNLPSVPNLRRVLAYTYTRARLCVCTKSNKGWEGWEGWEEVAAARLSASQPCFEVGNRLGSSMKGGGV